MDPQASNAMLLICTLTNVEMNVFPPKRWDGAPAAPRTWGIWFIELSSTSCLCLNPHLPADPLAPPWSQSTTFPLSDQSFQTQSPHLVSLSLMIRWDLVDASPPLPLPLHLYVLITMPSKAQHMLPRCLRADLPIVWNALPSNSQRIRSFLQAFAVVTTLFRRTCLARGGLWV